MIRLFEALWLFQDMLQLGIIPKNATLDAPDFARVYGKHEEKGRPKASRSDWLFARHWHSTLVDILTAKTKNWPRR